MGSQFKSEWKHQFKMTRLKCSHCERAFTTSQGRAGHEFLAHSEVGKVNHKAATKKLLELAGSGKLVSRKKGSFSHSLEAKQKLSKIAHGRNLGGDFCGRHFWHTRLNGSLVHMHSSYETTLAESLDKNQIKWERPGPFRWVDSGGVSHRYYADFYLPNYSVYLDPKNSYLASHPATLNKILEVQRQNPISLIILNKDELDWDRVLEKILILAS